MIVDAQPADAAVSSFIAEAGEVVGELSAHAVGTWLDDDADGVSVDDVLSEGLAAGGDLGEFERAGFVHSASVDGDEDESQAESDPDGIDPTPVEIRRECAAIRRNWSKKERMKRTGWRPGVMGIRVVRHPRRNR